MGDAEARQAGREGRAGNGDRDPGYHGCLKRVLA